MTDDLSDRPQQFKTIEAELHAVRERIHEENRNWVPNVTADTRDMRDPATVGETLLRMKRSGRHEDEIAESVLEAQRRREQIEEWAAFDEYMSSHA